MKRHESLVPLTHDHHHALAQARRLAHAAEAGNAERADHAREFIGFFEDDTLAHFREEEELVFPLVIDSSEAKSTLIRLLLEHIELHSLVGKLRAELARGDTSAETMTRVAALLQEHIRLEEKVLFPLVEQVAGDRLVELDLAPRDRQGSIPEKVGN